MKLNPDCVRDVLLSVERMHQIVLLDDGSILEEPTDFDLICDDLQTYSKADIFYTLKMLDDGGLIAMSYRTADGGVVYFCNVNGLTFAGHEFMQRIKDSGRWSSVKKGLDAIRSYSLEAMSAVAEGITAAGIHAFIRSTM